MMCMKVVGKRMRLTDWGRQFGLSTRASWQMYRDGRLPEGLVVEKVGKLLYVRVPDDELPADRVVLYACVSSSDQAFDLVCQSERLQVFARKQGWSDFEVVMETGSGLNGKRSKLLRVLRLPGRTRIVVEHRERLTRFGFELLEASLVGRGGGVVVMDDEELEDDLVRDVTEVLTSLCARLYGRRSAARRAQRALAAAGEGVS